MVRSFLLFLFLCICILAPPPPPFLLSLEMWKRRNVKRLLPPPPSSVDPEVVSFFFPVFYASSSFPVSRSQFVKSFLRPRPLPPPSAISILSPSLPYSPPFSSSAVCIGKRRRNNAEEGEKEEGSPHPPRHVPKGN